MNKAIFEISLLAVLKSPPLLKGLSAYLNPIQIHGWIWLGAALMALLAACSRPTETTGTLSIAISGLPSETNVSVTGPGSYSKTLTATTTLTKLTPGSYTISAPDVSRHTKTVKGSPAEVSAGKTTNASVDYFIVGPPGSLDLSFGSGGKVTTEIGASDAQATSVAVQKDGKIVVAGRSRSSTYNTDLALTRYNLNGSLDTSFGTGGKVNIDLGTSEGADSVAIQSDGKIVVAGTSDGFFALIRYNTNGSLDTGFGSGGKVTTDAGPYAQASFLTIQSDGKTVVVGYTRQLTEPEGIPTYRYTYTLVRYNSNGSLDTSFGTDGKVTVDNHLVSSVAIQSDGKIVVAGSHLARYNSNGSLDTSFGIDGKVATGFGYHTTTSLAIQSDGKIVVAGGHLARYNPSGSLDTSFGAGGKVIIDLGSIYDRVNSISIQRDGRIVLAGQSYNGSNYDSALARYNTNGTLDNSFGTSSKVITDFGPGSDEANSLVIQSDGKIVVAGWRDDGGNLDFALARYNTNGSLDYSFGSSGKVITGFLGSSEDLANSLAIQGDGKIVVTGRRATGRILVRYNTDGSLDNSFGSGGKAIIDFGSSSGHASLLAIQSDGKIVVAGSSYNGRNYDFAVARYNSNGSLDVGFGSNGKETTDLVLDEGASSLAIQSDGKIVAAGSRGDGINTNMVLVRYNLDGSLDNGFSSGGKVIIDLSSRYATAYSLAIQSNGKIVVAGTSNVAGPGVIPRDITLVRYNSDGSVDTSFDTDGNVITDFGSDEGVISLGIQSDGKIVVVGSYLVRYNTDGSLDTSFGVGGKVSDIGYSLAIQSNGKIVVAKPSGFSPNPDFALVRYNPDGSLDTSFGSSGKVTTDFGSSYDYASSLAIQSDGRIVVVGSSEINYPYHNIDFALARYNP